MDAILRVPPLLQAAIDLAETQGGVISRAELIGLGCRTHVIDGWLRSGRLRKLFRNVYAVGHRALRPRALWRAALMSCGDGTVLSHWAAAQLHGITPIRRGPIDVTTARAGRSQRNLRVHRTRRLTTADVTEVHGIACTTIVRTLIDLADQLSYRELRELADEPRDLDLAALAAALGRCPGRRGARHVRRLLSREEAHTKSEFERRYTRFARAFGLPEPDGRNVKLGPYTVDVLYAGQRVIVELDGRAHHLRRRQMREDRRRDRRLGILDYRVIRLVWEDLDADEAPATARDLHALLGGVVSNQG